MNDTALSHVRESDKDLVCVCSRRSKIDTHIVTKLSQNLSQVHAQVLEYHAQMALVVELADKLDDVLATLRVGLVELLQNSNLCVSSLSEGIIVSHHLDSDELLRGDVDGTGYP